MIKPPCKDCEERALKCHSACEKYKKYKNKQKQIKHAQNKYWLSEGYAKCKRKEEKKNNYLQNIFFVI